MYNNLGNQTNVSKDICRGIFTLYIVIILLCLWFKRVDDCEGTFKYTGMCHEPEKGIVINITETQENVVINFLLLITRNINLPNFVTCQALVPISQLPSVLMFFNTSDTIYFDVFYLDSTCYLNIPQPNFIYANACWNIMYLSSIFFVCAMYYLHKAPDKKSLVTLEVEETKYSYDEV